MTYAEHLQEIEKCLIENIRLIIGLHGKKSKFVRDEMCIRLQPEVQWNVDDTFITEVHSDQFLAENGHSYCFASVGLHKLAEVADSIIKEHKKICRSTT